MTMGWLVGNVRELLILIGMITVHWLHKNDVLSLRRCMLKHLEVISECEKLSFKWFW